MRALSRFVILVLGVIAIVSGARAQIGGKPIHIVFPFAPAGSGDAVARLMGNEVARISGRPVIIDNKVGASGRIGVMSVKQAEPDGDTILMAPFAVMLIYPYIYPDLGYNVYEDFAPLSQVVQFDFSLVAARSTPANNVREVVAWLKANPGKASFGTPGAGTLPHFLGAAFSQVAGVDLKHAPYRGASPAMTDVIGGNIPLGVIPTSDLLENVKSGNLKILGTFGEKRSFDAPDSPTVKEQGYDVAGDGWFAFYTSSKASKEIIAERARWLFEGAKSPEFRARIAQLGMNVIGSSPAELAEKQKREDATWKPLVLASGFKPED